MRSVLTAIAALSLTTALPASANPALEAAQQAAAATQEVSKPKPVWAFEDSDLPLDTAYRFGVLPNGMRYVIRHNATPARTGEVRLVIDAGSLAENDNELGYAHFIEHMAFNGSTHVPGNEMYKLLEREGLAFGADTNASTNYDVTLYKLDLPRNDPALLGTALMLMRETASEVSFEQDAIDHEKGVILSEKRVRDTYALRNLVDRLAFQYPDARFVKRLPIGTAETIGAATSTSLRGLYSRIYTPQNSAIVVVGDFDPDLVEQEIKSRFSDWAPAPQPPEEVDAGPVSTTLAGQTDIFIDPALPENLSATRNGPWIDEPDTVENRFRNLLRQIGYGIINRRFDRLANSEDAPFRDAFFGTSDLFESGRTTSLVVASADGEWRKGLMAAVEEYRRALAFGFSEGELAEQIANLRTGLENTLATAETRYNSTFTEAAIALLRDGSVPTTPQSTLARFEAALPRITPEAVLDAVKAEALPLDNPMLRFQGRVEPEGGAEALRAAWNEAAVAPVEARSDLDVGSFGYTDFGTPGTVVSDKVAPPLGIREIRFANGVRLNLKRTELKKDRVSFEINLDGGDMLNTRENPLATGMITSLPLGGLGKHSYDDLQSILAGRSVGMGIASDGETFQMQGTTTPRDLELQLQLMTAGIADPGYRPQGVERYRRGVRDFFAGRDATPSSALGNALGGIVSDGDPRFTIRPEADYMALDFQRLKADVSDRLNHGALEVALVGDLDEDQAIAMVARTLGALPRREEDFRPYTENRTRSFTADRSERTVWHDGAADQAMIRFSWPTRDDSDARESAILGLLDAVVQIELTEELREKLGSTYSPSVNAGQSRYYTGYGTFDIAASIDPADLEAVRQAIVTTITALRTTAVDDDTLLRARRPMVENIENALKTNSGWMGLVDRAQSEPDRIERFLRSKDLLESLTAEDLRQMAQRYLDPAQALEVVALPRPKAANGEE
ncbi:peptidase M16 [Erythrobacter sp. SG61-1L]|uniref:M16 family metallopeptidase n=1 Tax=Erythrobacter sp. SG61-1L TaxID=1603897 RepID=UPI0006C8FFEB|nr:M16 family metallopeptidase [Erythrobacter sp. SG61-1L]KPL66989.1 peptidase M16 [Erythrobacter sp. SG61-1L]